jgi:hypothetical protein
MMSQYYYYSRKKYLDEQARSWPGWQTVLVARAKA